MAPAIAPDVRGVATQGLRLIMASDGLWDLMSFTKAAKSCRNKLPHQAVASLVQVGRPCVPQLPWLGCACLP
jgi:serine/threonine protein phosphatase PrpC